MLYFLSLTMPSSKISQHRVIYAFCILLVTLSLFTTFGERGAIHLWRLWGEKRMLDERNFLLQKENEILRERIYRLWHDDLYLEKIAREDLSLVWPREIIYRFPSSESKTNRTRTISELPSEPPRSWAQKSHP
ncbi:MAG: septum formation initiator family protein [Deltaproteobacteria bacterium]|nr:septum formation initiator family protein [Deltaproteobacteria bacterium]